MRIVRIIVCLMLLSASAEMYGQTKKVVRQQQSKPKTVTNNNRSTNNNKGTKSGVLIVDRKPETGSPVDISYRNGQKEMQIVAPVWRGQVIKGQAKDKFILRQASCTGLSSDLEKKLWKEFANWDDHKDYRIPKDGQKSDRVNNRDISKFPSTYNGRTLRYIDFYDNSTIAYYANNSRKYLNEDYMMVTDNNNQFYKLNFSAFSKAPYTKPGEEDFIIQDISCAHLIGDILYVQHGHNTYAYSSGGKNAYISAINLKYNKVLWTTEPLTCNCNFIIVDNTIICGYGFSAEPDYLYLVDIETGQRRQTLKVASGPSKIVKKGNQIHVLTYSEYYVFDIVR